MMRLAGWFLVATGVCFAAGEARLADAVMNHDQAAANKRLIVKPDRVLFMMASQQKSGHKR